MKTCLSITLACTLTFALFACVDNGNEPPRPDPAPTPESIATGTWNATTGTGLSFDFTVDSTAGLVTEFIIQWTDWICGNPPAPHGHSESYAVLGTPITDRGFETVVLPNVTLYPSLIIHISGSFADDGVKASGNWAATEADQVCEGTWTALPEAAAG
jgi:hypothetical protein